MRRFSLRLLVVLTTFAALCFIHALGFRPWSRNWGATAEERARRLPGDDHLVTSRQQTQAITIHAPVERVWPWLAQLGQDRGGFYSFTILENLVGCRMPEADRILPEHQAWDPGDQLWMYPPEKLHGAGGAPLVAYEPGRALVFATRKPPSPQTAGTWAFVLEPRGDETRFLIRDRVVAPTTLLDRIAFDPAHFVMQRGTMEGLKARAEGHVPSSWINHTHVALWTITFALLVLAGVRVLRRPTGWARPLAVFAAAGLVFQILTFVQPPLPLGATLVIALAVALFWPRRAAVALPLQ